MPFHSQRRPSDYSEALAITEKVLDRKVGEINLSATTCWCGVESAEIGALREPLAQKAKVHLQIVDIRVNRHASSPETRRPFGTRRFTLRHRFTSPPNPLHRNEKCGSPGRLRGLSTSIEGVIRRPIQGWSDDGASHRVNCDTPPLKGYCQGT